MEYFPRVFRKKYIFAFSALVFVLAVIVIFNNHVKVSRADSGDLSGWAWSSNIGWVSLNCQDLNVCSTSDYKVQMDLTTGALSGYAWSSNIGWIQFDPTGPYPASPQTSAVIDPTTGVASGWMRALSYNSSYDDGWDGWINITSATSANGILNGWAWGGLVVGWLNFSNVTVPSVTNPNTPTSTPTSTNPVTPTSTPTSTNPVTPTSTPTSTNPVTPPLTPTSTVQCSFSANSSYLIPPQAVTLSWTCQNADSCSIDNGIGSVNNVSGTVNASPTSTTSYTLTCSNNTSGSTVTETSTVIVGPGVHEIAP